jgi:hypothetical protein
MMFRSKLKFYENDQKGKQHKRLDKSKCNDHHRLDRTGGSGIAGSTLSRTRTHESLPDAGQTGRKAKSDTGANSFRGSNGRLIVGRTACLSKCRKRHQRKREARKKDVFEFIHFVISYFYYLEDLSYDQLKNSLGISSPHFRYARGFYTPKESAAPVACGHIFYKMLPFKNRLGSRL